MTTVDFDGWMKALKQGWEAADADAIAQLFDESATYQHNPHEPALRGRDQIRDYWLRELEGADPPEVSWESTTVAGNRVVAEYSAISETPGHRTIDAGVLLLEFSGLACVELREYWMLREVDA